MFFVFIFCPDILLGYLLFASFVILYYSSNILTYANFVPIFTEAFRGFPIIRELEIPLNGLRSIKLSPGDYPSLEVRQQKYF